MPPPLRRLAAAAILCGIFAPWGAVLGTTAHLAADHHDAEEHHHFEASALHGHGHSADTPDHEHGVSLGGDVYKGLRASVLGVTLTPWFILRAAAAASSCPVPAPAVSPPRLAPIVLRT